MSRSQKWGVWIGLLAVWCVLSHFVVQPVQAQTSTRFLLLTLTPTVISETAGEQAAVGTITRSGGDNSTALTVQLSSDNPQKLVLPTSVEIRAGDSSATFPIGVVNNAVIDESNTALITAAASDYPSALATINFTDDEASITLSITPDVIEETSGANAATGTLTRTSASAQSELRLELLSDSDAVEVPETVTFPAGQTTVTFPIRAVDDDDLNGRRSVTISARRVGAFTNAASATIVVDDDESRLTLTISPVSLSEARPGDTATLTITRTEVAAEDGPASIVVESSDTSEASVPPFVFLPEGVRTVTLPVTTVDDGLVDGLQRTTLSAQVEGNPSARGNLDVNVADNDTPRLQLSLNTAVASESSGNTLVTGTVSRNTEIAMPLTVTLRSSDTTEAVPPATVIIPRGAVSATFYIRVPDDTEVDGTRTVTITASQSTFAPASASLTVYDNEGQALRVRLAKRQIQEDGVTVFGTVTRSRPAATPLVVRLVSSNPSAATFKTGAAIFVTIPANATEVTFQIATPSEPENTVPEDIQHTTVIATAAGYNTGVDVLRVDDNDDKAVLSLSIRSLVQYAAPGTASYPTFPIPRELRGLPAFPERAGSLAAIATLTRNTATTSELVVEITPGTSGAVRTPRFIKVPIGVRSVTFYISSIDDEICDKNTNDKTFTISARMAGFQTATAQVLQGQDDVCDGRELYVIIPPPGTPEPPDIFPETPRPQVELVEGNRSNATKVWVARRDDEPNYDLVVDLVSSNPAKAAVEPVVAGRPTRVVVPPIPSSDPGYAMRFLTIYDDALAEGCTGVTISPVAVGYLDRRLPASQQRLIPVTQVGKGYLYRTFSDSIRFTDNDTLVSSLTVRPSTFNESGSSGVATGVVTRRGPTTGALTVTVRSLDPSEIRLGPEGGTPTGTSVDVTIPAGEASASFAVGAVDELLADGDQVVQLEARESGECFTVGKRASVIVRDDELPELIVKAPVSVTENGTGNKVSGSVTRNTLGSTPLVVRLQSTDISEATVPATVTIPAGQRSVLFSISGVDDRINDGNQRVRILASATGFRTGSVDMTVIDRPVGLTLTVAPNTISEGASTRAARATLTRTTATTTAMTVTLASSNPSKVRVPSAIIIPAGSASVSFDVAAVDNSIVDGDAIVRLTATKTGLVSGLAIVTVLDNDAPALVARSNGESGLSTISTRGNHLVLSFSQPLNADAATNIEAYAVTVDGAPAEIESVSYSVASRSAHLILSGTPAAGARIAVQWNGLKSVAGNEFSGQATAMAR